MNRSKYRDLSKNTILFTISSFGSKIISFLLVPLYTHVLSTNDYGTADLISSSVSLLIPLLTLNIQDAVLRFALDDKTDKKKVISVGIKHNILGSGILLVLLYFLVKASILKLDKEYIYFLFLSFFFGGLYNSFSMYVRAKNKVYILAISGIVNTLIACVFNIVFLVIFKLGILGYLIANVSGTAVGVLIMFLGGEIYKDLKFDKNKSLNKEMIMYSLPLVLNSIAWWINNASDKYILTLFCGIAANGIFSVAYKIPTILSTITGVFYNAWSVSAITEFDKDDSDGFIGNIYTLYSGVSIISCSLILIFNYPLAKLLYAKDFFEAWKYVPFLLLGATFNGIALFEGCIFTAVKKTKAVFKTTLVGAGINTLANVVLIMWIGPIGAAIATMVGYFSIWTVRTIQVQKIVSMKVCWKSQILSIFLLTLQTVVAIYKNGEIFQIACFVLILFFFKKNLIVFWNKIKLTIKKK